MASTTEPDIFDSPPVPITHAQRHPELPLQPIVERLKKRTLTPAERANLNLGRDVTHDKRTQLNEKLLQFMADQDKKLEELALAEGATLEHCRTLLRTALKPKRKESVQNAFVSLKALELNADRAPGDKLKLKDIQAAVAADTSMQEATETEKEKVKELLAEKRLEKAVGARATHSGESKDMAAFSRKMGVEFFNLHQRTGAIGFGFLTRGDIDSNGAACWWACGNGVDFIKEKLNMGMWDMQRSFESWAIAASSAGPSKSPSNMNDRKKACATIILSNLVYITRSKDIQMSYANYDRNMIITHKVHLIGWPTHVPFGAPSTLTRSGDVRSLLEALETGSCHWEKVTKKQLDAAKGRVELEPPKKRRERSDVGGTHAKRKAKRKAVEVEHDDDEEDAGQSKRQKTSKGQSLAPVFSSPEHVTSDDDDDATVNGGED
ncbi:hypothetical protein C8J56DRAFT_1052244 [Mycena floridula]|nr:hypothetical protein C8J56DRAFT_1052244 [Mycena floridula]